MDSISTLRSASSFSRSASTKSRSSACVKEHSMMLLWNYNVRAPKELKAYILPDWPRTNVYFRATNLYVFNVIIMMMMKIIIIKAFNKDDDNYSNNDDDTTNAIAFYQSFNISFFTEFLPYGSNVTQCETYANNKSHAMIDIISQPSPSMSLAHLPPTLRKRNALF